MFPLKVKSVTVELLFSLNIPPPQVPKNQQSVPLRPVIVNTSGTVSGPSPLSQVTTLTSC